MSALTADDIRGQSRQRESVRQLHGGPHSVTGHCTALSCRLKPPQRKLQDADGLGLGATGWTLMLIVLQILPNFYYLSSSYLSTQFPIK